MNGNGASDTNPHLYTTTIGGSGVNSTVWAEGNQIASNLNGTTGPNGVQLNGYQGGSERSNCEISEVLIYGRVLSEEELNEVGFYLEDKYGIASAYTNSDPSAGPSGLQAIAGDGQV